MNRTQIVITFGGKSSQDYCELQSQRIPLAQEVVDVFLMKISKQ